MDPMAAIRETFFQECEEGLGDLEAGLLAMEAGDTDPELINGVFRAVHSIKGGAGAFNLDALVRFAHVFETALDEMRSGRLAPRPDIVKLMLRASDVLADEVHAARDEVPSDEGRSQAMAEELKGLGPEAHEEAEADDGFGDFDFQPVSLDAAPEPAPAPADGAWIVAFKPRADLYAKANETALLLRELSALGTAEVTLDDAALPPLETMDPEASYLAWTVRLTTEAPESVIREVFEFVDGDCELSVAREGGETPALEAAAVEAPAPDFDVAALIAKAQSAVDAAGPVVSTADTETPQAHPGTYPGFLPG